MRRVNFHVSRIPRKYPFKAVNAHKVEMSSWWGSEDNITILRIIELFWWGETLKISQSNH